MVEVIFDILLVVEAGNSETRIVPTNLLRVVRIVRVLRVMRVIKVRRPIVTDLVMRGQYTCLQAAKL